MVRVEHDLRRLGMGSLGRWQRLDVVGSGDNVQRGHVFLHILHKRGQLYLLFV